MVDNNVPNSGEGSPPPAGQPGQPAPAGPPPQPQTPPPAAPQYGQYQGAPAYAAPPKPGGSVFEALVKPNTLAMLVFVAMLLVLLGTLLNSSVMFMTDSSSTSVSHTVGAAYILLNLGMFISSTFLLLGGLLQKGADRYTRIALLIAGTLMLMAWIRVGLNPLTSFFGRM